jgi:transcriptional regulator with XRE-family HTH domain
MDITLDKQLKALRKERNVTQEELANHLGITVQAISK